MVWRHRKCQLEAANLSSLMGCSTLKLVLFCLHRASVCLLHELAVCSSDHRRTLKLLLALADGDYPVAGGLWGNPAEPADRQWSDTLCTMGTTCSRLSADHWCGLFPLPKFSCHSLASALYVASCVSQRPDGSVCWDTCGCRKALPGAASL